MTLTEIDESKPEYAINKLVTGSDESQALWTKHFLYWQEFAKFWRPRLEMGKKCNSYMRREIFTRSQRLKYMNGQDKIPIEPQEMKPVINSLAAMVKKSVRSGSVIAEDETIPEKATKPEDMNIVIKDLANKTGLDIKKDDALRGGLISGYPQWIWFDKKREAEGLSGNLAASLLPWDATLCSPHFTASDGSDIDEIIIVSKRTKSELFKSYPDRKKAFLMHEELLTNGGFLNDFINNNAGMTADQRSDIFFDMLLNARMDDNNGMYTIAEHYFNLEIPHDVFVNYETEDVQILPRDWQEMRKQQWIEQHPEYTHIMENTNVMWCTTIGSNGFVWENSEHWFQENNRQTGRAMLPGCPYIADMVDGIPIGAGEDMMPYILMIAVCETEGLSQVRKGTGTMTFVSEGALRHPKSIGYEMSQENGVAIIKKGFNVSEAVKTEQRRPNDTYHIQADRTREQLKSVHNVNESIMGGTNPRQSDLAKKTEIAQGMTPQAPYVRNFNSFSMNVGQLLCYMAPYVLNTNQIIEIKDEFGRPEGPVEINKTQFNYDGTVAQIIANDLVSVRYRFVLVPGDDSPIRREQELKDFVEIMESVGNSFMKMDPRVLSAFLAKWPNKFAQEAGATLGEMAGQMQQEQAQADQAEQQANMDIKRQRLLVDLEKAHFPKWMLKVSPVDIQQAPQGFQVMMQYLTQSLNNFNKASPDLAVQAPQMPQMPLSEIEQQSAGPGPVEQQQQPMMNQEQVPV